MEDWYRQTLNKKTESYLNFKVLSPRQYGPYTYLKADITVDDEFDDVNEFHLYTYAGWHDPDCTIFKCLGIFKSGPPDWTRL